MAFFMRTGDKLTEPLSTRISSDMLALFKALAEHNRQDPSERLRQLIELDIEHHRLQFDSLASIFGQSTEEAKR